MPKTSIEWTDLSWPVVNGCRRKSAGCKNCYAERLAATRLRNTDKYRGLAVFTEGGPRWTGASRLWSRDLSMPVKTRKSSRIFVADMGDLFYEEVPFDDVDQVFAAMLVCRWHEFPRHTFQILTKRPERMREYLDARRYSEIANYAGRMMEDGDGWHDSVYSRAKRSGLVDPGIWLGVSVEDQKTADERIPLLLQTPAAVHFISAEPLLGELDLSCYLVGSQTRHVSLDIAGALRNGSLSGFRDDAGRGLSRDEAKLQLQQALAAGARVLPLGECDAFNEQTGCPGHPNAKLDWVIVGGESGHGAREFDLEWAESIVEQCRDTKVHMFVKQLGARPLEGEFNREECRIPLKLKDRKGGDWSEWPEHLRVREFPRSPT